VEHERGAGLHSAFPRLTTEAAFTLLLPVAIELCTPKSCRL
jgi:hypothetical protein